MILTPEIDTSTVKGAVAYYKTLHDEIYVLICNKCRSELAVEVKGNVAGQPTNDLGFTVLPVGNQLLGSRPRLDGVMGYSCICGNDTRANPIEESLSPSGAFMPHEVHAIKEKMARTNFKPLQKIRGNRHTIETFTRVRI